MRPPLHAALVVVVLAFTTATVQAQAVRPRAHVSVGAGLERVACGACREPDRSVFAVSGAIGASHVTQFWSDIRLSLWSNVDLIESPPYTSTMPSIIAGYQVHPSIAPYAGIGKLRQHWSSGDVTSSGMAAILGVEFVLGRTRGIGGRGSVEVIRSMDGERVSEFDGEVTTSSFRPMVLLVGLGVIWR